MPPTNFVEGLGRAQSASMGTKSTHRKYWPRESVGRRGHTWQICRLGCVKHRGTSACPVPKHGPAPLVPRSPAPPPTHSADTGTLAYPDAGPCNLLQ
eukprot:351334-Chlamydomonas_euryale.AAC.3